MGSRFRFFDDDSGDYKHVPFFDRQVRAFGKDIQLQLQRLNVGVVGVGGTGSAVVEQLARLGIGTLSIFDGDHFDNSNVNRVYGSSATDSGIKKVDIAKRNVTGSWTPFCASSTSLMNKWRRNFVGAM